MIQNNIHGVLLCGGRGSRLRTLTGNHLPKSLMPVAERPLIQYTAEQIGAVAIKLLFAVGEQEDAIIEWVEHQKLPIPFSFSRQETPGIAPAILAAAEVSRADTLIVANTDEIRLNVNTESLIETHYSQKRLATLAVGFSTQLYRHRVVSLGTRNAVVATTEKPAKFVSNPHTRGLINYGMIAMHKEALCFLGENQNRGWTGVLDPLINAGQLAAHVFEDSTFFNVGTQTEYLEAQQYLSVFKNKSSVK